MTEVGHAFEGNEYVITGVASTDTDLLQLSLFGTLVGAGEVASIDYKILGMRWRQAHVDIGDFMQLGTADLSLGPTDLPLMTVDYAGIPARVTIPPDNVAKSFFGMSAYAPWAPAAEGVSIGFERDDTTALTNVYLTSANYDAATAWTGDSSGPGYTHGWSRVWE